MFYQIARVILRGLLHLVFRIRVVGLENVPAVGGGILAVNHRSNWDVVISGITAPRKLRFMAKSELFDNKLLGKLITSLGAFPVHRGKGDIGAIKAALGKLKAGHIVAMFPEGKRVREGEFVSAKPGVVMLAIRGQVPVIPTYISGKYQWLGRITVHFGPPIYYDTYYEEKVVMEQLQQLSDEMLRTMRALGAGDPKREAGK